MSDERTDLVVAEGLGLATRHAAVFTDLHFRLPAATLSAVTGPAGSGRSSLLLAVGGRMRGLTGFLQVAGLDAVRQARAVRARASVARISGLVELEGQLLVSECIAERALIDAVPPARAEAAVAAAERTVGLAIPRSALVDDLPALEQAVLAAVLATVRPSRLVLLDDADARLDLVGQRDLLAALGRLAATGPAVLVSTTEVGALNPLTPRIALARTDVPQTPVEDR